MAHKEEAELAAIIWDAWKKLAGPECQPQQTLSYIHCKSGSEYVVNSVALRESDLTPLVIYQKKKSSVQFARPLNEFLEKFQFME